MTDKAPVKRKARPKPIRGVTFAVWNVNGSPIPEEAILRLEAVIEVEIFALFNEGHRLLTSTIKA